MEFLVYLTFETINYSTKVTKAAVLLRKKKLLFLYILRRVLHYLYQTLGI